MISLLQKIIENNGLEIFFKKKKKKKKQQQKEIYSAMGVVGEVLNFFSCEQRVLHPKPG